MTRLRPLGVPALLFLATLILYSTGLKNDFVNYDDDIYVYENGHMLLGLSWEGIRWCFTTIHDGNWIPFSLLSHLLDFSLFGFNPLGHHLTSFVIHGLNTALVFTLLRNATRLFWPSLVTALLFAAHPMHVESVAWVSERKDVLCAGFFLLSLIAYGVYTSRNSGRWYLTSLLLSAAALMAKPMAVSLPLVLLVWDHWPLRRWEAGLTRRRIALEKLPFALLALGSSGIALYAQEANGNMPSLGNIGLLERLVNALTGYASYLGHFFRPTKLAVFYPLSPHSSREAVGACLLLAGITAAAIMARKRFPCLLAGWAWFVGTLLPVSGIVQVGGQQIADRYTYLPYLGLFIIVTYGGSHVAARWRHGTPVCTVLALVVVVACSLLSIRQISYWKNSTTLFTHALEVTDMNYLAHNNLGMVLKREGRIQEAMEHFRRVVAINPGYSNGYYNLGIIYEGTGNPTAAIEAFRKVLELNPADTDSRNHLDYLLRQRR